MAGSIAGTVKINRIRQPIEGATVTARPGDHSTSSAPDGTYSIPLDAGTYSLTITASGFDPFDAEGLFVVDGVATEINAVLWPSDW